VVILADDDGVPLGRFILDHIERDVSDLGANGKRFSNGCNLMAKKGSARRPNSRDPKHVPVSRHPAGALSYFDARTGESMLVDISRRVEPVARSARQPASFPNSYLYRFLSSNVGKTLRKPERDLIRAYACWIGSEDFFEHHRLPVPGLFTDLFIPRLYALVEAKATITRESLRYAIGQLFDYQRYYTTRHPRLAVLLPAKPSRAMIELLDSRRIGVIWRSRGKSFADSCDGRFTCDLRKHALSQQLMSGVPNVIAQAV